MHAISSDPEPDADDWDSDVHNPPTTSTARTLGLSSTGGGTRTGTSTPGTDGALKEFEGSGDLKIDIDWALMNDEFDAWMEGDSSGEDEEQDGGEGNLNPVRSGNAASKNMGASEDEWTDETNSIIRQVLITILAFNCSSFCPLLAHRSPSVNVCAPSLPQMPILRSPQLEISHSVLLWPSGKNSQPIGLVQVPN